MCSRLCVFIFVLDVDRGSAGIAREHSYLRVEENEIAKASMHRASGSMLRLADLASGDKTVG